LISGERPLPRSGDEILEIAAYTEFFEEGRIVRMVERQQTEVGSIEYVPRTSAPNAVYTALTQGLLVNKFTLTGTPDKFQGLDPGTYYTFVDYIESQDPFEGGRWVARIVNSTGGIECLVTGVELKEAIHFHIAAEELEEHTRPRVALHGFSTPEVEGALAAGAIPPVGGGASWLEADVYWHPLNPEDPRAGCIKTVVCVRQPPQ
jgi:hypothetical protein